jgi:hypothetical protein
MNKETTQILEDLKDLLTTLRLKQTTLKDDKTFLSKWSDKNQRVKQAIQKLNREDFNELNDAFSEWINATRGMAAIPAIPNALEKGEKKMKNDEKGA